jgi:isoleucyl-tRNA synthetase
MRISNEILARLVEAYRKIRNTSRFLLGNLSDLDPSDANLGKLNKNELTELDRLALSMLQSLIKKVSHSYETFAFYEVYHAIYRFCIMDMSSFYLDILKDKLYTFKTDSIERRAAQAVLYNILISLTKLIAPILSFTAEELWKHLPGDREESVFLSDFPEVNPEFLDLELESKWDGLSKIRDEVNKALELKRQEKFIGNALEAKVVLYAQDSTFQLLKENTDLLPTLFIVSAVELGQFKDATDDAYSSTELDNLSILVNKADGNKCERCWNWDISVGDHHDHPGLCKRCHKVLAD